MMRLLLLSLAVINLPAAQMTPKKPAMASLEGLPVELKNLVLLHIGVGSNSVLNIPALAQGITSLAATSKKWHAVVNNPQNMLIILKSLPRAGAVVLVEKLQAKVKTLPVMTSKEVDAWLKSFTLEGGEELFNAVRDAVPSANVINKILSNPNANVNWKPTGGVPALMLATIYGQTEFVRALVAAGANVDMQENAKNTALIMASEGGHVEIARILLAAGADVNKQNKNGETALMFASKKSGRTEVIRALLAAGADVSVKDNDGHTALMLARIYPKQANEFNVIIKLLEDAEKAQKEKVARK